MDKAEKKRLQREHREKQKQAFFESLPMSEELFLGWQYAANQPLFTSQFLLAK